MEEKKSRQSEKMEPQGVTRKEKESKGRDEGKKDEGI